jgi:hypothetical protein
MPLSPRRLAPARVALGFCLGLAAIGCGSGDPDPGGTSSSAQVFHLDSGPLREIRIARATDGRFVVSGFCYFPDDTRLTVSLRDSSGGVLGRTRPVVANGLFDALPIGPGETLPIGEYEMEIAAGFSPGDQPDAVLEETGNGRALEGEGMFTTQQGHYAFAKRFPVEP